MLQEFPIIADFTITSLSVTLRDYRTVPAEDHKLAIEQAGAQAQRFADDSGFGAPVLCSKDERIEQFRRQAFLDAKDAGLVTNFQEFDALGLGLMDDYVKDPRYQDQSLLIYDGPTLIGSFMMLKLRFNPPVGGKVRACATPWLGLEDIPGRGIPAGVLWAMFMNYIHDTDLLFTTGLDVLDIVEWIFPVDRPELDLFKFSDSPGHKMAGIRPLITTGRDTVIHPGSGITKHIRRSGEVWTPEG